MSDSVLWGDYTPRSDRTSSSSSSSSTTQAARGGNDLDKNAFLMLLITQMKYQDPLNPMDNQEFVAQMAQFTALEQMQNLNSAFQQQQGYSMIGKTVVGTNYNSETGKYTDFAGRVNSVTVKSGEVYIVIGEGEEAAEYKMSDITNVYEDYEAKSVAESQAQNIFYQQNINLVGRCIQAITFDSEMNPTGFVEGIVDYVKFTSGSPILVIGNQEVFPGELISVSETNLVLGKTASIYASNGDGTGYSTVTGKIESISIIDGKAYVNIGGKSAQIEKIDALIEAMKYVGKEIKSLELNGVCDGVLVKNGVPYMLVGDEEVKFSDILK